MSVLLAVLVAVLVGAGFFLSIRLGVAALRLARRNRAEATAMMCGTYLKDVEAGLAPPPTTSVGAWLGEVLDAWCEGAPASSGDAVTVACDAWHSVQPAPSACHAPGDACSE